MKLGICTTDFPAQPLDQLCDTIKQYGFSQVQFDFATIGEAEMPARISPELIGLINRAFAARDLEMTAINGTFNAIDPDLSQRAEGVKRFAVLAGACAGLNCNILTICTGTRSQLGMWQDHPDNASEQAWREMIETVSALADIAEKYQVYLGVETEASNVVSTPQLARRLLDEIKSPWLKIIMDCANLFHKGQAAPEHVRPTIHGAFECLGRDIILAHGKDIYASDGISFATPGKGIIDYDYFLQLLQQYDYRGGMLLHGCETPADIPAAADFMRRTIDESNDRMAESSQDEGSEMDKLWQARWIMDPRFGEQAPLNVFHKEMERPQLPEHRNDLKNTHMLVRKMFTLAGFDGPALLDITADDYYKLYVNGRFIAQGPAPGYYFHYYYNRHDITAFLQPGQNVIAVHVYYQGLINRVWNSGDYRQGLIAELSVGGELVLSSNRSWKYQISKAYASGGLIGYDTQVLENINACQWDARWRELDFDDREWLPVRENLSDDHKLFLQKSQPVDVYAVKPRSVVVKAPGHFLVDFGQEITGSLTMQAHGDKGEIIELRCGEEMADQDSVRYRMRCNCDYQEFWTLSGRDKDILEFYDYKAFRYAEVIGSDKAVDPASIAAVVQHYPLADSSCVFSSSSPLLNQIWQICRNGVKYSTQEAYLDCPSREKGQYLGDATITAPAHLYLSGDLELYKKQLHDFALSSFISPGLMAVAPGSLMQEIADFSMLWPMQLLSYYRHSGDRAFLKEMVPICQQVLEYFQQYARPDGLLEAVAEKWNLVDWPENLRDGYDFALTKPIGPGLHNVINAFYFGLVDTLNQIHTILDIPFQNQLPQLRQSFINAFFNERQKLFVDSPESTHTSLHSNVLPLFFGIAAESARPDIVAFIKEKKFSCGVYMSYFVLKALAGAGDYQAVYDLITMEHQQSWANMLSEGATTCFEAWGKDQKWNTSLCHPWASAPIPVLIEDIIGLKPLTPGWQEICFKPNIPHGLEWLNLEFDSPAGRIKVKIADGRGFIEAADQIRIRQ